MRLRVLNPCHEDFDAMDGDDRRRFCVACRTYVHDLSEMTRDEAEAFLAAHEGKDACVRYLQGPSGEAVFRPRTTAWRLGFVAVLSLAMAACTGHMEPGELELPDTEVCYDADGYAIACDELDYSTIPDAIADADVDIDVDADDVPNGVADDPPESCPIPPPATDPDPKPKTRRKARRRTRRSRRDRARRTMGVMIMGR